MSLPYFPMYPSDFEAKTSHLTLEEDGAYNRLLRLMWMSPGCSLPDDNAWIMRRMRVDQETFNRVVLVVIEEFCTRENGRVSNAKLTRVFGESLEAHKRRVLAGSKGGKNKALKTKETGGGKAKAKPKQPEPEPEPDIEDSSNELSLVPSEPDENRSRKKYPDEFESFWKAYPKRPTDTKALAFKAWFKGQKQITVDQMQNAAVAYKTFVEQTGHESLLVQTWVNREGWTADYSNHRPMNGARASPARRPSKVDDIMEARAERNRRRKYENLGKN